MNYVKLRLPINLFNKLKTRLIEEDGDSRHKKYINNNRELCKPIAEKIKNFHSRNKSVNQKAIKFGYTTIYRSFFDFNNDEQNGATIFLADWICKYLSSNTEITFFKYQKITKIEKAKELVIPFFKEVELNQLEDFSKPLNRNKTSIITSESIQDNVDETKKNLTSLFEAQTTIERFNNLGDNLKIIFNELLLANNIQIKSLNLVERIVSKDKFEYVKLDHVYVNRSIQKNIIKELKHVNDRITLLVEGQAGRGKTSLLWFLHNFLIDEKKANDLNFFPLFVKSLDLREGSNKDIINKLIIANDYVKKEKKKSLLLLIDTVDLLLQEEGEVSKLEFIFSKLSWAGISIVCTSRIQEAFLLKSKIKTVAFTLGDYNHNELKDAIRRHTFRYVGNFDTQELETEYERILELVDKGYPIKEVCYNPLTLRMLYSIYVPNKIPTDINIHELYKNYWEKRITKDFRVGIDNVDDDSNIKILRKKGKDIDLEEVTFQISMMMLMKGEVEIEENEFLQLLSINKIDSYYFSLLKNRDIVKSSNNRLTFFHQTFFEFAAAKAMTVLKGVSGFDLFKNRVKERPNNLFLLPIFEQLLLLNENHLLNKNKVPQQVISLFRSKYVSENHSAIYVFSFLQEVEEEFNNTLLTILKEKEEFIPRYFELLPNVSKIRLPETFRYLDDLNSEIKTVKLKNNYIDLLYRFASYSPKLVKDFISKNELSKEVYSSTLKNDRVIKFVKTLGKLQKYYFDWAINEYLKLMHNFKNNSTFQTVVFNELNSNLENLKPEHFNKPATYISENISLQYNNSKDRVAFHILDSFANLWLYEWGVGKEEIIFNLCWMTLDENNGFEFESKLLALSKFIVETPNINISNFLTFYYSLTVKGKVKWARNFMFYMLLNQSNTETISFRQLVDFIQKIILNSIEDKDKSKELTGILAGFNIKTNLLSNEVYKLIFSSSEYEVPRYWIDNINNLIDFLPQCYFTDCVGAVEAVDYFLKEKNNKTAKNVIRQFNGYVGNLVHQKEEIPDKVFLLLPYFDKLPSIVNLTRKLDYYQMKEMVEDIDKIRTRLLDSPNVKNIRKGLEIFILLLEKDLTEIPNFELFQRLFKKVEGDKQSREKLFAILSKYGNQIDFHESKLFFEENLMEVNQTVMDTNFDKYIDLLLSNKKYIFENFKSLTKLVIEIPKNIQYSRDRLSKIKGILNPLIQENQENVFEIYTTFLSNVKEENFNGDKSINHFSKLIKSLIFNISKILEEHQLIEILELTMFIPKPIGKVILDSIYLQDLVSKNINEILVKLNKNSEYPIELKEYIAVNEGKTYGRFNNETWKELEKYLIQN